MFHAFYLYVQIEIATGIMFLSLINCVKNLQNRKSFEEIQIFFLVPTCESEYVGKQYEKEGSQYVNLGASCWTFATILHELMHVLGKLLSSTVKK